MFKRENEAKVKHVLFDKTLVAEIRSKISTASLGDSLTNNYSFVNGKSHKDRFSSFQPDVSGFDILSCLFEIEADLVGRILSYCNTATIYSLRLVCRLWWDIARIWFVEREAQLINDWKEGVASEREFVCQDLVSVVAADDFSIVVGLENGKLSQLNWVF